jgi:hypothetical protein
MHQPFLDIRFKTRAARCGDLAVAAQDLPA